MGLLVRIFPSLRHEWRLLTEDQRQALAQSAKEYARNTDCMGGGCCDTIRAESWLARKLVKIRRERIERCES